MALPNDLNLNSTQDGTQIRLDMLRVDKLDALTFDAVAGSALVSTMFSLDFLYVLVATEDCIVDFSNVAVKLPSNRDAVVLQAGERATIMLPPTATGFSVVGLASPGTLYIQRFTPWSGLGDGTSVTNE